MLTVSNYYQSQSEFSDSSFPGVDLVYLNEITTAQFKLDYLSLSQNLVTQGQNLVISETSTN